MMDAIVEVREGMSPAELREQADAADRAAARMEADARRLRCVAEMLRARAARVAGV